MKKRFTNRLALTVLAIVLVVITVRPNAAKAAEISGEVTEFKDVKHINKIQVRGNVEVFINQSTEEGVKVYDEYYKKNAMVQWEDGVLRICSYKNEKLTVLVNVTDLNAIEASGDVKIRSLNKLSSISMDIALNDNAQASLETQSVNLYTAVADSAKLSLSGDAENQEVELSGAAQLELTKLTAQNRSFSVSDQAIASYTENGKTTLVKNGKVESQVLSLSF